MGVVTGLYLLERIGYIGVFRVTGVLFILFAIPKSLVGTGKRREQPKSMKHGGIGQCTHVLGPSRCFRKKFMVRRQASCASSGRYDVRVSLKKACGAFR